MFSENRIAFIFFNTLFSAPNMMPRKVSDQQISLSSVVMHSINAN